jgi:AcrR family transcriptional regulator
MLSLDPCIATVNTHAYGAGMAERLNRMDWVRAGLAVLSKNGLAAVGVEPLARQLAVTKGSFYWHFADREALLSAMIAEWERAQTFAVIEEVEAAGANPSRRLEMLSASVERLDMRLEMAVRAWGALEPKARKAIARIDATRLGYLQSIIESAGVPKAAAEARARLIYYALIGQISSGAIGWRPKHHEAARLNRAMILAWP